MSLPPVNPSDSTTHVYAIRGRIRSLRGNVCEMHVRPQSVTPEERRGERREEGGGLGTCFEPAVIGERLAGLLRFVPVLLEDGRTSDLQLALLPIQTRTNLSHIQIIVFHSVCFINRILN